jgi:hypothetical protein
MHDRVMIFVPYPIEKKKKKSEGRHSDHFQSVDDAGVGEGRDDIWITRGRTISYQCRCFHYPGPLLFLLLATEMIHYRHPQVSFHFSLLISSSNTQTHSFRNQPLPMRTPTPHTHPSPSSSNSQKRLHCSSSTQYPISNITQSIRFYFFLMIYPTMR